MFCTNCGAACKDGTKFCAKCGTALQAAPTQEAPVQEAPTYEAPVYETPTYETPSYETPVQEAPEQIDEPGAVAAVKKFLHFIVAGVAGLALILSILNLFGLYDVSVGLFGFSRPFPASEVFGESVAVLLGNILYALFSLVIAGIGALYFLKVQMNNDLYDNFVGKFANPLLENIVGGDGILTLMGGIGAVAGIIQLFFYIIASPNGCSVSMNFTSWLALILYVALAVCDVFWLNKKQK